VPFDLQNILKNKFFKLYMVQILKDLTKEFTKYSRLKNAILRDLDVFAFNHCSKFESLT